MSMDRSLPLLAARHLQAPLAWRHGKPVSGEEFLAQAAQLMAQLPAQGPAVNLCKDRYAFAVGMAAALLRGHTSVLPADARPETLARLRQTEAARYVISDDGDAAAAGLPCVRIDPAARAPTDGAAPSVPLIDGALQAVSLLTSGSTGTPQPHAKSWRVLADNVAVTVACLSRLIGRASLAGVTLVATVPAQHSYGLESSLLLALLGGAAFDSSRPFFPADVAQALESVPRPRALVTTPFHLKTLLCSGLPLPQVDLILSAAAPLSPQLALQAEQALGGMLIEIYGSTETGQVAARRSVETDIWQGFGDLRIDVETDGAGHQRFVFDGSYLPRPVPMADLLELVGERRFRLLGRANDLIHVAGRRNSLGHLNYHLNSIPGVEDGAFWLPDEVTDGVVRPVAFVVAPALGSQEIAAALRQRLEAVFVPRRIVHVAALPRQATGKLAVRALREFALAQLARGDEALHFTHQVPLDHPAFAGHFPDHPVLPGATLLSMVLERVLQAPAMAARLGAVPCLAHAKFLAPVRPGASLRITLAPEPSPSRAIRFDVRDHRGAVAAGRWTPARADA